MSSFVGILGVIEGVFCDQKKHISLSRVLHSYIQLKYQTVYVLNLGEFVSFEEG